MTARVLMCTVHSSQAVVHGTSVHLPCHDRCPCVAGLLRQIQGVRNVGKKHAQRKKQDDNGRRRPQLLHFAHHAVKQQKLQDQEKPENCHVESLRVTEHNVHGEPRDREQHHAQKQKAIMRPIDSMQTQMHDRDTVQSHSAVVDVAKIHLPISRLVARLVGKTRPRVEYLQSIRFNNKILLPNHFSPRA